MSEFIAAFIATLVVAARPLIPFAIAWVVWALATGLVDTQIFKEEDEGMSRGGTGPRKPREMSTEQRNEAYAACGGLMLGSNGMWRCRNHCRVPLTGRDYCREGEAEAEVLA